MNVSAVILTFNEEKHLARCLASLEGVVNNIFVIDCFSTDATVEIAEKNNAKVLQREWINYATQFNWALTQICDSDWVLRIDADEIVSPNLADQIKLKLPTVSEQVNGIYVNRRMTFIGNDIRYGGVFPIQVLRFFRHGYGECENRWMDEHIKVRGDTLRIDGEIIDDNLNSLTWWTDKHNKYASREAIDLLNLEFNFIAHDTVAELKKGNQAGLKRWLKEKVYARLPLGFRSFIYFLYRYIFRLGFLDGQPGLAFHFLQGFWYRYLVDAKVIEVKQHYEKYGVSIEDSIECVLNVKLTTSKT